MTEIFVGTPNEWRDRAQLGGAVGRVRILSEPIAAKVIAVAATESGADLFDLQVAPALEYRVPGADGAIGEVVVHYDTGHGAMRFGLFADGRVALWEY